MDFAIWLPRVLGVVAGVVASKLTEMSGVVVDPVALQGIALAVYSLVHRGISSKVNPVDAASEPAVREGRRAVGKV